MKRTLGLFVAGLFAAFTVVGIADAQEEVFGKPAEQVGKFERMIGHWEGKGQLWEEPGVEPTEWTANQHVAWVLDGNFVQEDLEIHATAFPTALSMRAIYGWDSNSTKYVSFGTSNMGNTFLDEGFWIDNTFVINRATVEGGGPLLERVSLTYGSGKYDLKIERGIGVGEFHTHAAGTFTKVDKPSGAPTIETSAPIAPAPKPMTKLNGLVGDWKMAGKMRPMPGMPEMPVGAIENMRSLFGGACVTNSLIGEENMGMQYKALGFFTWNPRTESYDHVWFDNMGSMETSTGHLDGNQLVFQYAGKEYGVPVTKKTVMTLNDEGHLIGVQIDRTAQQGEAERSFDVKYTPIK